MVKVPGLNVHASFVATATDDTDESGFQKVRQLVVIDASGNENNI